MIDSYEIQNSVIEWLKIIETKNFADDGMLLRTKIPLTIWQNKNTSTTRVLGGFIRTSKVPILCERRTDLTSKRHCQPCSNWNQKNGPCKRPRTLTDIDNGHKVLLHCGIGKVHGGLLVPMKFTVKMKPSTDRTGWPVVQYLDQFFWARLSSIQLLCYRWIVYSWRRSTVTDGRCKHNTSNDMFSRCKCAENGYREKWRSIHTAWQHVEIGNKLKLGPKVENSELAMIAW